MGALGVVFLLVILGQNIADPPLVSLLSAAGWVLWAIFVAELALRAYVADDRREFWRRNWWQVVFLAVPFLRFARALRAVRAARIGGVLGSAVRGSRSAGRLLTSRIGWLALVSAVVILASSQLLVILGAYDEYDVALHAAALATIAAEPLAVDHAAARWLEVGLATYSVAVFATLAGALGAFFLEQQRAGSGQDQPGRSMAEPQSPTRRARQTVGAGEASSLSKASGTPSASVSTASTTSSRR